MGEEIKEWETANRFVAVIDVMGFKDFVSKNTHEAVVETMRTIKNVKDTAIDGTNPGMRMNTGLKSIQFSDSIFIFSISDSAQDLVNILHQCRIMMAVCITQKIPMKGAVSHGLVTAEFSNSIFVGQPIIDAHLLQEDLQMFGAALDHNAEKKLVEYIQDPQFKDYLEYDTVKYKTPTKNGKMGYYCLAWPEIILKDEKNAFLMPGPKDRLRVEDFYSTVSGKPRIYIDNTLEFIDYLVQMARLKYPGIKDFVLPPNSVLYTELKSKGYYST